MSEFDDLLAIGYAESKEQLFVPISIDRLPGVTSGAFQTAAIGKSLAGEAGFEMDTGGQLILHKADVTAPEKLSGAIVTRTSDGLKRRIRAVDSTRISYICDLMPEDR
jgi:hypothetical protein